jgi:hypothetical protein
LVTILGIVGILVPVGMSFALFFSLTTIEYNYTTKILSIKQWFPKYGELKIKEADHILLQEWITRKGTRSWICEISGEKKDLQLYSGTSKHIGNEITNILGQTLNLPIRESKHGSERNIMLNRLLLGLSLFYLYSVITLLFLSESYFESSSVILIIGALVLMVLIPFIPFSAESPKGQSVPKYKEDLYL